MPDSADTRMARAMVSLDGLSVGDAFGAHGWTDRPSGLDSALARTKASALSVWYPRDDLSACADPRRSGESDT
jgi:hypothetical protein